MKQSAREGNLTEENLMKKMSSDGSEDDDAKGRKLIRTETIIGGYQANLLGNFLRIYCRR